MCEHYVSFVSKVRPSTVGCISMGSALLFILRSRLLLYSAGSGVCKLLCRYYFEVQIALIFCRIWSVQVALSGFSVRLLCFVHAQTLCRYGCMYFLDVLVLVCVDVMVISSA